MTKLGKIHLEDVYPSLEMGGGAIFGQMIHSIYLSANAVNQIKAQPGVVVTDHSSLKKVVPGESVTFKTLTKGEPKWMAKRRFVSDLVIQK